MVDSSASKELLKLFDDSQLESELLLFSGGHEIPWDYLNDFKSALLRWNNLY